jgi:subtilisin family serine protease
MKKLLLAVVALCYAMTSFAQSNQPEYQDGKIWFRLQNDYRTNRSLNEDPNRLDIGTIPFLPAIAKNHQVTNLSRPFHAAKTSPELQRTYLLEFTDYANVDAIINELKSTGKIDYAERVPLDRPCLVPNDPGYSSQWHLNVINAAGAWNYFSTGSTIKIAIVDDAVERTHSDISPNLWVNPGEIASNNIDDDGNGYIDDVNGYDVGSNDNNPNPPNSSFSHGTHVTGCASPATNNGTGVAGIGFSCKIMAVKATTSASAITNGYDGVVYAVVSGADVINMSWGGTGSSTTAQNVINWAYAQGVVLVAAAGNNNTNTMFYPAGYTNCIAVAATNSNDTKANFSNYGTWVDISAPGNNIYATYTGNTYANNSGTSMASPIVAGLCGLMLSLNPSLTPSDIRNCLTSTATSISAQNPSYNGQLGSGRINANAAMQCISSTLNWAPVAGFVANVTTVTAGGNVQFTDQSVYNPTSWSWSFPGGTPASFNGQNPPPIVYNTPGTYNVSLTVSNVNGSDIQTNTSYITVTTASGCEYINLPLPVTWTPVNYFTGAAVGQDGWINGNNIYDDREKAMYFDASASPYTQLVNVWVAFGRAYSANPAKIVSMKIYDGTSGTPGAQIGSTINATMGQIMADEAGGYYTEYSFVNTPVTLPASKRFFVSLDITSLQWGSGTFDTLSIVSNTAGETSPSVIWEKQSDNLWYRYTTAGSWNLSASLLIHPFLTGANTVATFTQSATTICQGDQIIFDATGSTYEDTLLWYFPGSNPQLSNSINPTVTYNTPGTYQAVLYVVGGGCSLFDSAFVNITVNPTPTVAVNVTPGSTVCSGTQITLQASGANSYVWSPSTFLSSTTASSPTATPTTSITYNVQGTAANGCSNNTTIPITVVNIPVASLMMSDTFICVNGSITFDGSNSTDATSFAWSFPGGSPATSTSSAPVITYNATGTFTAQLIVTNTCGNDTINYTNIGVGCMDIPEQHNEWSAFYNAQGGNLQVNSPVRTATAKATVVNSLGQVVYAMQVPAGTNLFMIDMSNFAPGMYSLLIEGEQGYSMKFVKE